MMEEKKTTETVRFHSPLQGGELVEHTLETREDPLTGHRSVSCSALQDKAEALFPATDWDYLRRTTEETAASCFLCPEDWRQKVPSYPADFLSEGTLERGDAALFPNLFPIGPYHAVVRLGDRHIRTLGEMPAQLLRDGLEVAAEFVRRCWEYDPAMRYATINANHLFPAGASLVHPHFQVLVGSVPSTHHELLLGKSEEYMQRTGSCYWEDLVAREEESGERWIGRTGPWCWMSAFSPKGLNEIQAVLPKSRSIADWTENEPEDLARGLSAILQAYHQMGQSTYTMTLFSAPPGGDHDEFRCLLRLMNRQNVMPHYRTDDYFFQKIMGNELILTRPEALAARMRKAFV
jgi:galactose-1-phosphate uridylyltransferase